MVTPSDPPYAAQGMVRITLDPRGRLESLKAQPSPPVLQAAARRAVDWNSLLAAAGLDGARFTPSPPGPFLPVYADSRMAWTGSYGPGRPDTIRVEAAALDGLPVYFFIQGPWQEPEIAATPPGERFANIFGEILVVAVLIAAALVAWRNVRMGRGDKKGAWRVAAVLFAAGLASWALAASHVPTLWELWLLMLGLSWAAFQAGFVGVLYLAVEPFIRKNWPDALISWVRIVGGRFRDPLAGSHVLAGVCVGLFFPLLMAAAATLAAPDLPTNWSIPVSLSGARFLFGLVFSGLNLTAFSATGIILVLVLLRSVVSRTWVADALFVVLLTLPALGASPVFIPGQILENVATIWVLRRFGLLAFAAMVYADGLIRHAAITVASWYAAFSMTAPLILAAVAAWSLYTILASRPGAASRPASESRQ